MNPTENQASTPVTGPAADTLPMTSPTTTPPVTSSSKSKKKLGLIVAIAAAAVVIFGGSAAAYYGVVVPNKPENLLKKAVNNLTEQNSFSAKGKIDVTSGGSTGVIDMNMLHLDSDKKAMLADMKITASGISLPIEVRYLNETAYVKLGDLSTIKSLVSGYGGAEMAPVFDEAEKKLSNQWVEIDKTLLSQATASNPDAKCTPEEITLKTRAALNETAKLAVDDQNAFYIVQKSSKETVDGQKTTKLELTFDSAKAAEFAKKTKDLPAAKDLANCMESKDQTEQEMADEPLDVKTFNVWIDGSKHVKRFEVKLESGKTEKTTMTVDMTMVKDAPTVAKPDGAKPLMQLYGEVVSLFGGSADSSLSDIENLSGSLSL